MIGVVYFGQYWFGINTLVTPVYTAPPFDTNIVLLRRRKVKNS